MHQQEAIREHAEHMGVSNGKKERRLRGTGHETCGDRDGREIERKTGDLAAGTSRPDGAGARARGIAGRREDARVVVDDDTV